MSRTHLGVAGPYSSRTALTSELGNWESAGDVTHLECSVPASKWRNRSHYTNYMPPGELRFSVKSALGELYYVC